MVDDLVRFAPVVSVSSSGGGATTRFGRVLVVAVAGLVVFLAAGDLAADFRVDERMDALSDVESPLRVLAAVATGLGFGAGFSAATSVVDGAVLDSAGAVFAASPETTRLVRGTFTDREDGGGGLDVGLLMGSCVGTDGRRGRSTGEPRGTSSRWSLCAGAFRLDTGRELGWPDILEPETTRRTPPGFVSEGTLALA